MAERGDEARWSMRKQSKRGKDAKEPKDREKKEEKPDKSLGAMIKNTFKGKKRKDGGSSESFSDLDSIRASGSFSIPVIQSPGGPEFSSFSPRAPHDGEHLAVQPESASTPRHDSLPAGLLAKSASPSIRSIDQSLSDSEFSLDSAHPLSVSKGPGSKTPSSENLQRVSSFPNMSEKLPPDPNTESLSWRETVTKQCLKGLSDKDIKRQELIYELIQTERNFKRHLSILQLLFRKRIESHRTLEGRDLLTRAELATMFGNLDEISEMHAPLCTQLTELLERSRGKPVETGVGPIMAERFACFDPHRHALFCAGQRTAVDFYHSKMKTDGAFAALLRQIELMPECARLKFPDFKAKVMQRLSKYPLLLGGIIKYTPTTPKFASELTELNVALKKATCFMEHVDAYIKLTADRLRLQFVQAHMDLSGAPSTLRDLDITKGTLIREGPLDLLVDHNPREIHVMLLSDCVLFFQVKESMFQLRVPGRTLKGEPVSPLLPTQHMLVRQLASQKNSFVLVNKVDACMYQLAALSRAVQQAWLKDLNALLAPPAAPARAAVQPPQPIAPAPRTPSPATQFSRTPSLRPPSSLRGSLRSSDSRRDAVALATHSIQLRRDDASEPWGWDLAVLENLTGLGVARVQPQSLAAAMGLKMGDVIVAIDGTLVQHDFAAAQQLVDVKLCVDLTVMSRASEPTPPRDGEGAVAMEVHGDSSDSDSPPPPLLPHTPAAPAASPFRERELSGMSSTGGGSRAGPNLPSRASSMIGRSDPLAHPPSSRASSMRVPPSRDRELHQQQQHDVPATAPATAPSTPSKNPFAHALAAAAASPSTPRAVVDVLAGAAAGDDTSTAGLTPLAPLPHFSPHSSLHASYVKQPAAARPDGIAAEPGVMLSDNDEEEDEGDADEEDFEEDTRIAAEAIEHARKEARRASEAYEEAMRESLEHHPDVTLEEIVQPTRALVESDPSTPSTASPSPSRKMHATRDLTPEGLGGSASPHIVLDIGATQIRMGFAGEDLPRHITRAVIGSVIDVPEHMLCGNDVLPLRSPLAIEFVADMVFPARGVRTDFHGESALLAHVLEQSLAPEPKIFAVDGAEATLQARMARRLRLAEILFSPSCGAAGVLFAEQAFLACLGSGRRCALIVHSGDTFTHVVPVVRGTGPDLVPEPLLYASMVSPIAGRAVSSSLAAQLRSEGHDHFEDRHGRNITMQSALGKAVLDDIKESVCFVSTDTTADLQSCRQSSMLEKSYELAGGCMLILGRERFECSEILFAPATAAAAATPLDPLDASSPQTGHLPVQELVRQAIAKAPADLQAELWGNIVLSGGNTLLAGYPERLARELGALEPGRTLSIVALPERRLLPWMGAAIMARLGSAQTRFVTSTQHRAHMAALEESEACFGFDSPPAPAPDPSTSPYALDVQHTTAPPPPPPETEDQLTARLHDIESQISALQLERERVLNKIQASRCASADDALAPLLPLTRPPHVALRSEVSTPSELLGSRRPSTVYGSPAFISPKSPQRSQSDSPVILHDTPTPVPPTTSTPAPGEAFLTPAHALADDADTAPPTAVHTARNHQSTPSSPSPTAATTDAGAAEAAAAAAGLAASPRVSPPPQSVPSNSHAHSPPRPTSLTIESPGSAAGKEDVGTWPVGRVLTWLLLVDLQSLSDLFQTNGITGEDLLDLTDADLLSMGMTSEALRARVLREAATLSIASFA